MGIISGALSGFMIYYIFDIISRFETFSKNFNILVAVATSISTLTFTTIFTAILFGILFMGFKDGFDKIFVDTEKEILINTIEEMFKTDYL
jgi:hypothetical protein